MFLNKKKRIAVALNVDLFVFDLAKKKVIGSYLFDLEQKKIKQLLVFFSFKKTILHSFLKVCLNKGFLCCFGFICYRIKQRNLMKVNCSIKLLEKKKCNSFLIRLVLVFDKKLECIC